MMVIVLLLGIVFLGINALILRSDIREKKIPNQHLLALILLSLVIYGYRIAESGGVSFSFSWLLGCLIAIIVSFGLYYYGIWSAGDAKYLLVLSLFLPRLSVVSLIGNIAILTIAYIAVHYVSFYGRLFFRDKAYTSSFWKNSWKTKRDALLTFLKHPETERIEARHAGYKIFKFVLLFFVIFISLRLARQYFIEDIRALQLVEELLRLYPSYGLFAIWVAVFGLFVAIRKWLSLAKKASDRICMIYNWKIDTELVFSIILFGCLTWFILYEYAVDPADIGGRLFLVFTLYLGLYLLFRLLHYSYLLVFHLGEQDMVSIDRLSAGDIVDKPYLIGLLGSQIALGASGNAGLLAPDPQKYLERMDNPIDGATVEILKDAYRCVNEYHTSRKTAWFQDVTSVKVLRTFPFGIYLFFGFCMTYLWGDGVFQALIRMGKELLILLRS